MNTIENLWVKIHLLCILANAPISKKEVHILLIDALNLAQEIGDIVSQTEFLCHMAEYTKESYLNNELLTRLKNKESNREASRLISNVLMTAIFEVPTIVPVTKTSIAKWLGGRWLGSGLLLDMISKLDTELANPILLSVMIGIRDLPDPRLEKSRLMYFLYPHITKKLFPEAIKTINLIKEDVYWCKSLSRYIPVTPPEFQLPIYEKVEKYKKPLGKLLLLRQVARESQLSIRKMAESSIINNIYKKIGKLISIGFVLDAAPFIDSSYFLNLRKIVFACKNACMRSLGLLLLADRASQERRYETYVMAFQEAVSIKDIKISTLIACIVAGRFEPSTQIRINKKIIDELFEAIDLNNEYYFLLFHLYTLVSPKVVNDLEEKLLAGFNHIASKERAIIGFCGLLGFCSPKMQQNIVNKIITYAATIKPINKKVRFLLDILVYLPEPQRIMVYEEVLHAIDEVQIVEEKFGILQDMLSIIPYAYWQSKLEHLTQNLNEIEYEEDRMRILINILSYVPVQGRVKPLEHLLTRIDDIDRFDYSDVKSEMLNCIIPILPEELWWDTFILIQSTLMNRDRTELLMNLLFMIQKSVSTEKKKVWEQLSSMIGYYSKTDRSQYLSKLGLFLPLLVKMEDSIDADEFSRVVYADMKSITKWWP